MDTPQEHEAFAVAAFGSPGTAMAALQLYQINPLQVLVALSEIDNCGLIVENGPAIEGVDGYLTLRADSPDEMISRAISYNLDSRRTVAAIMHLRLWAEMAMNVHIAKANTPKPQKPSELVVPVH